MFSLFYTPGTMKVLTHEMKTLDSIELLSLKGEFGSLFHIQHCLIVWPKYFFLSNIPARHTTTACVCVCECVGGWDEGEMGDYQHLEKIAKTRWLLIVHAGKVRFRYFCVRLWLSWTNSKLIKERLLFLSLELGNKIQMNTCVYRIFII